VYIYIYNRDVLSDWDHGVLNLMLMFNSFTSHIYPVLYNLTVCHSRAPFIKIDIYLYFIRNDPIMRGENDFFSLHSQTCCLFTFFCSLQGRPSICRKEKKYRKKDQHVYIFSRATLCDAYAMCT